MKTLKILNALPVTDRQSMFQLREQLIKESNSYSKAVIQFERILLERFKGQWSDWNCKRTVREQAEKKIKLREQYVKNWQKRNAEKRKEHNRRYYLKKRKDCHE